MFRIVKSRAEQPWNPNSALASIYVVFWNKGDGDDVLFPHAELTIDNIKGVKFPLTSGHFLTIKAHSFQQVRYTLDTSNLNDHDRANFSDRMKNLPISYVLEAVVGNKRATGEGRIESQSDLATIFAHPDRQQPPP